MRNPFRPWAGWILSQDLDQVTGGRSIDIVFCIIAAVAASNGTAYRYPLTLRLVK
jgi:uncharacterized Tic20 family protein